MTDKTCFYDCIQPIQAGYLRHSPDSASKAHEPTASSPRQLHPLQTDILPELYTITAKPTLIKHKLIAITQILTTIANTTMKGITNL